jgi:hypothetical protein
MIELMQDGLSLMQHHDAISGTDTQLVDIDYRKKISKEMN